MPEPSSSNLSRQIGLFDATMLVMGGIVGAGIFMNPSVVARQVQSPVLNLLAWTSGGAIALVGAFVYAELAGRMPAVGGQYAYLRDAYHPLVGFMYGWVLLLVIQTGGMAAVTVTFARYFVELTHLRVSEQWVAVVTLTVLTMVNCLGVKLGSRVQSSLMVLKIAAILALIGAGFFLIRTPHPIFQSTPDSRTPSDLLTSIGAAMVPVLFAYGGWETSNFVAGEIKEPGKNLGRALLMGVSAVVVLYLTVSFVCLRALGASGLAGTDVPASAVMRLVLGERGATLIAFGIAVSTLGFLSQNILTGPRVYFAMAKDRLFFRSVARVTEKTHVPAIAIILQSVWTAFIVLAGRYEQILNYESSMNFLFFGMTATCVFAFRARDKNQTAETPTGFRVPGHPVTTVLFIATTWVMVANTVYKYPSNCLPAILILLTGLPAYALWRRGHQNKERNR